MQNPHFYAMENDDFAYLDHQFHCIKCRILIFMQWKMMILPVCDSSRLSMDMTNNAVQAAQVKLTDFTLNMTDFALKMMNFLLK